VGVAGADSGGEAGIGRDASPTCVLCTTASSQNQQGVQLQCRVASVGVTVPALCLCSCENMPVRCAGCMGVRGNSSGRWITRREASPALVPCSMVSSEDQQGMQHCVSVQVSADTSLHTLLISSQAPHQLHAGRLALCSDIRRDHQTLPHWFRV
jgi:hypothetical protein